jgi:hypothetical protein
MRLPLILLLAAVIAAPAAAQGRGQAFTYDNPVAKLTCTPGAAFKPVVDAIAASAVVREADPEDRGFCLFIGAAGPGPWRRYAVVQMEDGPYWCGSAGCQVLFFIEDRDGRWKNVTNPDGGNNAFALEEGVLIDASEPVQGLPTINLPQRHEPEIGYYGWRFDEKTGTFKDPMASLRD